MKKIEIHYIGSKGGCGWYQMTWLVNKEALITIDTWYRTIDDVLIEFIEKSGLEFNSVEDVAEICDKVITSLSHCEREFHTIDDYNEEFRKQGNEFFLKIYKSLRPKTQKEPLMTFEK